MGLFPLVSLKPRYVEEGKKTGKKPPCIQKSARRTQPNRCSSQMRTRREVIKTSVLSVLIRSEPKAFSGFWENVLGACVRLLSARHPRGNESAAKAITLLQKKVNLCKQLRDVADVVGSSPLL